MIDFIKFDLPVIYQHRIRKFPFLEFKSEVNLKTGELIPLETAKYHCLKIKVNPYQVEISGSLHKFWNSINGKGEQNYDDFNFIEARMAILLLAHTFQFHPQDANILNMEFGVNVRLNIVVDDLLKTRLSSFKYQRPSQINYYDGKGNYVEFAKSEYYLKVYDKGAHYKLDEQILRVEVKTKKSVVLARMGIESLYDLLEPLYYFKLKNELLKKVTDLVILDSLDFSRVNDSTHRTFLQIHSNPSIWLTYADTRKKRIDYLKFNELCAQYGFVKLKTMILENLAQKCTELLENAKLLQSPFNIYGRF